MSSITRTGYFHSFGVNDHASVLHGLDKVSVRIGTVSICFSENLGLIQNHQWAAHRDKAVEEIIPIQTIMITQNINTYGSMSLSVKIYETCKHLPAQGLTQQNALDQGILIYLSNALAIVQGPHKADIQQKENAGISSGIGKVL